MPTTPTNSMRKRLPFGGVDQVAFRSRSGLIYVVRTFGTIRGVN